jgi:predicted secreted acid phosphatase
MELFSAHALHHHSQHQELIRSLRQYHADGGYARDVERVAGEALAYLRRLRRGRGLRAIVLDIDETALSNAWRHLVAPNNAFSARSWAQWIAEAKAPVVRPTLEVFQAARTAGLEVFFVSGRPPRHVAATKRNLRRAGYDEWSGMFLEPRLKDGETLSIFPEAAAYKTAVRWSLVERGYRIVLNMGDQTSDLSGGYADKTFKLPNPFYTII